MRLKDKQIQFLLNMLKCKEGGSYWAPSSNPAVAYGNAGCATIRSLWKLGLAEPVAGCYWNKYACRITELGRKAIAPYQKVDCGPWIRIDERFYEMD